MRRDSTSVLLKGTESSRPRTWLNISSGLLLALPEEMKEKMDVREEHKAENQLAVIWVA